MFFPKGDKTNPQPYNGGRGEEDFIKFLNEKCQTWRTKGGLLSDLAGRMPTLDGFAARWYTSTADKRSTIYNEFIDYVNTMRTSPKSDQKKNEVADYYLRVLDKANHSAGYIEKETKRLTTILKKHAEGTSQLAAKKVDELTKKKNVLLAFVNERIAAQPRSRRRRRRSALPAEGRALSARRFSNTAARFAKVSPFTKMDLTKWDLRWNACSSCLQSGRSNSDTVS